MELSAQSKRGLNAIAAHSSRSEGTIERTHRTRSVVHARVRFAQTVIAHTKLRANRDRSLQYANGVRIATEREITLTKVSQGQVRLRVVNVLRHLQQERERFLGASEVVQHGAERIESLAVQGSLVRIFSDLTAKNFDRAAKRPLGLCVQSSAPVNLAHEQMCFAVFRVETDRTLKFDER
jgi:hypothetical protein